MGINPYYLNDKIDREVSSTYTFNKQSEQVRLGKAVSAYSMIDKKAIDYVLSRMHRNTNLYVIDLGCADGSVTESRFGAANFVSVIGVDYNKEVIGTKTQGVKRKFQYYNIDLDATDLEQQVDDLMLKLGIDKFDIVFSSLVMQHLKNPNNVIRCFANRLRDSGAMILRGVEDGNKVAYADNGLVAEIIYRSANVKGISDRFYGRKMYTQMYRAGLRNIKLMYEERDTVGKSYDEKMDMFHISFAYRKDYFERQLATEPGNATYQTELKWICRALKELKAMFEKDDFYYMEVVPVAIGFK